LSQALTEFFIFKIIIFFIAVGSKYYKSASGKKLSALSLNISFILVYNIDIPTFYVRFPLTVVGFLQS